MNEVHVEANDLNIFMIGANAFIRDTAHDRVVAEFERTLMPSGELPALALRMQSTSRVFETNLEYAIFEGYLECPENRWQEQAELILRQLEQTRATAQFTVSTRMRLNDEPIKFSTNWTKGMPVYGKRGASAW